MNATERARRSDALYRDDATMHRRDLCDMVAAREAEIAELREHLQEAEHEESVAWDRVRTVECQSDKLRELIHILCYCMHDEDCDGCRLNGERGEIVADPLYACDGLHELLRKQGIEGDA